MPEDSVGTDIRRTRPVNNPSLLTGPDGEKEKKCISLSIPKR